jgi:lysophospholipase L1-like esterase
MPVIRNTQQVRPEVLSNGANPWRIMSRCDTPSGEIDEINQYVSARYPEKLIFAEGDSWFDKFTPIPNPRTNLLQEIRLPFNTVVVDVSTVGDESADMVKGWQAWRTQALFRFGMHSFDAILLSAGGNDLKNLYASKIDQYSVGGITPAEIEQLSRPSEYEVYFGGVIENIQKFIEFRNQATNLVTRKAPILLHGYDYFQPRPAKAEIFSGGSLGRGPWLYPALHGAGFTDSQMRSAADAVVDQLNNMLAAHIAPLENVHVIDSRGFLTPARAGSTSEDVDWLDEIHPNSAGFEKLARCCWNKPLAELLGHHFHSNDLIPVSRPITQTTALSDLHVNAAA